MAATDPTQDDQFERQPFAYVLDRVVPADAVLDPNQLQILQDADYEWWWTSCERTDPALKLIMSEVATGRYFMGSSVFAGGGAPFAGLNIDLFAGSVAAGARPGPTVLRGWGRADGGTPCRRPGPVGRTQAGSLPSCK